MSPQSRRPSAQLVALRAEATVLMSLAIGQAGLAAGFLTGSVGLKPVHGVNALVMVAVTIGIVVTAVNYQRRGGGPRWPILAGAIILVVEIAQLMFARLDLAGPHIFLGVLFVVMSTLLTSYLFRPGFIPPARRVPAS